MCCQYLPGNNVLTESINKLSVLGLKKKSFADTQSEDLQCVPPVYLNIMGKCKMDKERLLNPWRQ